MKNHMKAEPIEQIREHLARGGRVRHTRGQATLTMPKEVDYYILVPDDWELLPIEEKPISNPEVHKFRCPHDSNGDGDCHLCFRDNECRFFIVKQRIRQSLLFGHYPSLDDLRDWWQATTGERIEWGRRCNYCECSGKQTSFTTLEKIECCGCNGSGYTVRPTWMGERKATGDDDPGTM